MRSLQLQAEHAAAEQQEERGKQHAEVQQLEAELAKAQPLTVPCPLTAITLLSLRPSWPRYSPLQPLTLLQPLHSLA